MMNKLNNRVGYIINESAAEPIKELELTESGNRVIADGVLQTGNTKNRNGRLYKTTDLVKEINAPRQQELLSTGNMKGEAGHPMSTDLARQQTIDPKYTCVRFLKFWHDGDNIMGRFKGDNNQLGDAFDKDLRDGVLPAFSLRALGGVEETPSGMVVVNLKMITYDYVIYPSHPTAYTKGIVSESANIGHGEAVKSNMYKYIEKNRLDANTSLLKEFTNNTVLSAIQKESAIDYIKDKSHNYSLMKEAFDLTKSSSVDLSPEGKIIINEAGVGTIVMNVEDYIRKEIFDYVD